MQTRFPDNHEIVVQSYNKPYKNGRIWYGKEQPTICVQFFPGDTVVMRNRLQVIMIVRRTARDERSDPTDFKPLTYYMPLARTIMLNNSNIVYRPVDRRDI